MSVLGMHSEVFRITEHDVCNCHIVQGNKLTYTHTHTHIYIYIQMYVYKIKCQKVNKVWKS